MTRTKENWILLIFVILTVLFNADYAAVNLALVSISETFHVPISYIQWALSAYALTWAMCSIPGGKLVDYLGAGRALFIGLAIFVIGSLVCGFSYAGWLLIFGRVVQAIGAATCFPALYGIVIESISDLRQKMAFGLMATSGSLGLILGPSLSGLFIHYLSWRYIFFINVPLILFAYLVLYLVYNFSVQSHKTEKLDIINLMLFMLSIFAITLWLNRVSTWGVISPQTLLFVGGSILLFGCFLFFQGKNKPPVIRGSLFKSKKFTGSNILYIVTMYVFTFSFLIISIYLQNIKNYTAFLSGAIFLSFSVSSGIMSLMASKLLKIFSSRFLLIFGELLMTAGLLAIAPLSEVSSMFHIIVLIALLGGALGLLFPTFNIEMSLSLPKERIGEGSGIFLMFGLLFASICAVVLSSLLTFFLQSKFYQIANITSLHLSTNQTAALNVMLTHIRVSTKGLLQAGLSPHQLMPVFYQSFHYAMRNLAWTGAVFCLVSVVVVLWGWKNRNGEHTNSLL